jgi:nucleoid-associated protein YgaU
MRQRPTIGSACRAVALTALATAAAAVTWRLRPPTTIASGSPDAAVVLGCAWLAWALAGYLAIAVAATATVHLLGARGTVAHLMSCIAPRGLRRLVDAAVTLGTTAAVISSTATAPAVAAPISHVASSQLPGNATSGSALDWPGLSSEPPHHHRHHPDVGKVNGGHATVPKESTGDVVVQPGDTLWSIAARRLGPTASGAAITAAWHAWYAANRNVIGSNPSVIQPGQRLTPPTAETQH